MGTENIQTYKNVCKLFSRSHRGQSVRCCHFCPQKETSYDLNEYDEMVNNFIPVYRRK